MALKIENSESNKWFSLASIKGLFLKNQRESSKPELNLRALKIFGLSTFFLFLIIVLLLPDEETVEFRETIQNTKAINKSSSPQNTADTGDSGSAYALWGPPSHATPTANNGGEVNYNSAMVLGSTNGNAKTQIQSGQKLQLRILEKVIVAQEPVPVLAELLLSFTTPSGLKLSAGTKLYGSASFKRGGDRAEIQFTKLSTPNGEIKTVSALALGKDGQPGVPGKVYSDGIKNSAGQIITTFVGGFASGSMEKGVLGGSSGGIKNGLLSALAETAKGRASDYGEALKTQREWIELRAGTECDGLLTESFNLQKGGPNYE